MAGWLMLSDLLLIMYKIWLMLSKPHMFKYDCCSENSKCRFVFALAMHVPQQKQNPVFKFDVNYIAFLPLLNPRLLLNNKC